MCRCVDAARQEDKYLPHLKSTLSFRNCLSDSTPCVYTKEVRACRSCSVLGISRCWLRITPRRLRRPSLFAVDDGEMEAPLSSTETSQPLLEKLPPVARPISVSGRTQLVTLLLRKELLLKLRRPLISVGEILFPVGLCAILIAGSTAASTNHYNATSFEPAALGAVLGSLGPQVVLPVLAQGEALSTGATGLAGIPTPGAVPPLGLYLFYAKLVSVCVPSLAIAPVDGSALAVAQLVRRGPETSWERNDRPRHRAPSIAAAWP